MRKWVAGVVVLAAWCEVAAAKPTAATTKPRVAILGLEVVVSGAKADPKDLRAAAALTESLRAIPRSGIGAFEPAPGGDRELIDEKLAGNCDTELPECMATVGHGLEADHLVYGNLVKTFEEGKAGYQVNLKILDVNAKPPKPGEVSRTFVPASALSDAPDGAKEWAQRVYAKLTGEPPPAPPPKEPTPGRLVLNANAKSGDVLIDDSKRGRLAGGTFTLELPAGSHEIAIEAPGYERYGATVIVASGQTRTTTVELEPRPLAAPLTLGQGRFLIAGSTINLDITDADDGFDHPVLLSFAPSVWYGITDRITIGITHDSGATPWTPRPTFFTSTFVIDENFRPSFLGTGICVTDGCPESPKTSIYNSIGADALFSFRRRRLDITAHPGVDATVRYPFVLDARLGALGRYLVTDRLSIVFDPRLRFSVIDHNNQFYHNAMDIPIWGWFAINDKLSIYLHTGFNALLGDLAESYAIPLQAGTNYKISRSLTIGLDFGFANVKNNLDYRALGLRILWAP